MKMPSKTAYCLTTLVAILSLLVGEVGGAGDEGADPPRLPIPVLDWEPRSDWKNVRDAGAVGDGVADDTEAIQSVLETVGEEFTVYAGDRDSIYFPPGTYRITAPLRVGGEVRLHGVLFIGHGRDTRLVWDGPEGKPMLSADGITYARYEGLVFDGKGRAGVGILHPNKFFSTETRYSHLAFLGLTDSGIKVHPDRRQAQSDVMYDNCYFEDCGRGVAFLRWNDYHHAFDGCEFRNCGIGIQCTNGSFYIRNSHFAGSRTVDIKAHPHHSSSVRRVTSVGSQQFLLYSHAAGALTVQDVHVATDVENRDGVVRIDGPPVTLFDSSFTCPQGGTPPVKIGRPDQRLILSNNRVEGAEQLLTSPREDHVYHVPAGGRGSAVRSAGQRFIRDTETIPGKVFDAVRDFGAAGDGKTDDTEAIQATIDAAREHGEAAIAYLPARHYVVSDTLQVTGSDYYVGGQGWGTEIRWRGPEGGTILHVHDPQNVTVEYFQVSMPPSQKNDVDILQTSSGGGSSVVYDGMRVFGCYRKRPFHRGLHLKGLGAKDRVVINTLQGNVRVINSADATIIGNFTWEGSLVVEGRDTGRDGFLGFVSRLATISTHPLYVRDNHSVVVGDFYHEQSDGMFQVSGSPDLPAGRVVFTGGRSHVYHKEGSGPSIDGYRGEIFIGGKDFSDYRKPDEPPRAIVQTGEAPVDVYIFGSLFYGTKLQARKEGPMRLFLIGNDKLSDPRFVKYDPADRYTEEALEGLARAFDDLSHLGEMDLKLNHPEGR